MWSAWLSQLAPRTQVRLVGVTLPMGDGPWRLEQLPQLLAWETDSATRHPRLELSTCTPLHRPCWAKRLLWRWKVVPDSLVPWCRVWWRHGTNWTRASRHPAHLSGSRAETWSSCLHPHTPVAQCPAHLQDRMQEQVTSLPIAHTLLPGTFPQPGTKGDHPALQCKQRGAGLSAPLGELGKASSTRPHASWGLWG